MKALIVVDIQNDFCPGGALAVKRGDQVVDAANRLMPKYEVVAATQDWHPAGHGSFASSHPGKKPGEIIQLGGLPQILWPDHCVQGTTGAEFHPRLDTKRFTKIFQKGTDPGVDSYSGFFDNGKRHATGLGDWLKERGIIAVDVLGLATDYCVKATALDAVGLGLKTSVLLQGCRAVDLKPGDAARAVAELRKAGVEIVA